MKKEEQLKIEEMFKNDTREHVLTIVRSDGLYRHIKCAPPGSWICGFEIVTWPGYLAYVGDMGSYVFERTKDMFEFFRRPDGKINPGYWAEKCQSQCVTDAVSKFSVEKFKANVVSHARDSLGLDEGDELPADILEEIEPLLHAEDEWECVDKMRDFDSELISFDDFFESDIEEYSTRYIWCCIAIVWAINKFDAATAIAAE